MAGWDYEQLSKPLADPRVDNYSRQPAGEIDELPALSLDIPDSEIIRNIDTRVEDSRSYWNQPEGFDLDHARTANQRLYLGRQIDVTHLYRFQVPYVENEIFVGIESIVGYVTAQQPQPEVYPAQDNERSKIFATDLEKALSAHSQNFALPRILETCVRNLLLKRLGVIKFRFDPDYGPHGEIIPEAVDPEHIIVDKNASKGSNPEFICHILKMTVDEVCQRWPKKKKEVYEALGIERRGIRNTQQIVGVREVWITHYDTKGKPQEGCVIYLGKVVLDKYKDPNWLYASNAQNFLNLPQKPFIPLNYLNDGTHWIDITTPVEQASTPQNILNKRGRQIMENADKANGMLVISTDSGLTKDDAQNLTGDPNQKLIIKTNGQRTADLVYQVPPHDLPAYVMNDKMDLRTTVHAILGTPTEFTGQDDGSADEETLGQAMMKKNQASMRQDLIVRAIDDFMDRYFKFLVQMMVVWYDEKHFFTYNGGDGEFDYIVLNRELFEDGIAVSVKSGTTLPFDKSRQEAVALQLAKMGMISPLDLYRDLHMDKTQQRYDNWFKWKTDPMSLARDADEEIADDKAYIDFVELMNGKPAKPRDDASKEHILTHRKQMLTDVFLKAPRAKQMKMLEHVEKELTSLEMRSVLDQMSSVGPELLDPSVPLQNVQPPGQPMQPGQPPQQPPMPGQMPGMPPAMPPPPMGAPQPGPVTAGTGLPNPANPVMPPAGNPTALPVL